MAVTIGLPRLQQRIGPSRLSCLRMNHPTLLRWHCGRRQRM